MSKFEDTFGESEAHSHTKGEKEGRGKHPPLGMFEKMRFTWFSINMSRICSQHFGISQQVWE